MVLFSCVSLIPHNIKKEDSFDSLSLSQPVYKETFLEKLWVRETIVVTYAGCEKDPIRRRRRDAGKIRDKQGQKKESWVRSEGSSSLHVLGTAWFDQVCTARVYGAKRWEAYAESEWRKQRGVAESFDASDPEDESPVVEFPTNT